MYIYIIKCTQSVGYTPIGKSKKHNTLAIITDNIYYRYTESVKYYPLIVAVAYNVRELAAVDVLE